MPSWLTLFLVITFGKKAIIQVLITELNQLHPFGSGLCRFFFLASVPAGGARGISNQWSVISNQDAFNAGAYQETLPLNAS